MSRISLERLRHRLDQLGAIGRGPDGGITRLPFTAAHREAIQAIAAMMAEAGLTVGVDEFGILIGRREGDADRPAILLGSHLDTVPHGGMFDGALGVIAGIECAQTLAEAGVVLRHPLAVVAFADEEGAGFGLGTLSARCLVGQVRRSQFVDLVDGDGRSLAEHLAALDLNIPAGQVPAVVNAYLELHLEQGPTLDRTRRSVAAVEAITGMLRTTVTFHGRANHAGTTPMADRADALCGAAEFTLSVRDLANASEHRAVGTVGTIQVSPGATNIVPGEATVRVDLRSPDEDRLQSLRATVSDRAADIARHLGLRVVVGSWDHAPPIALNPELRASILQAMASCNQEAVVLPSWAGHDAAVMARYVPTGMIFVATTGGISHSPNEHASWHAVEIGTQVLLETVGILDAAEHRASRIPLAYRSKT